MIVHPEGYVVKLVRDRVADMLGGDGTVTYRPMPREEHVKRLRAKLVEEALEYALDPSKGELADLLEAAQSCARVDLRIPWETVEAEMHAKRLERGGFVRGVGMYALHPADVREGTAAS